MLFENCHSSLVITQVWFLNPFERLNSCQTRLCPDKCTSSNNRGLDLSSRSRLVNTLEGIGQRVNHKSNMI